MNGDVYARYTEYQACVEDENPLTAGGIRAFSSFNRPRTLHLTNLYSSSPFAHIYFGAAIIGHVRQPDCGLSYVSVLLGKALSEQNSSLILHLKVGTVPLLLLLFTSIVT
jgi:hypothetical protein